MNIHYLLSALVLSLFFMQSNCQHKMKKNNMQKIQSKIGIEQYKGKKLIKPEEYWKEQLSAEQFYITQKAGTERPFTGEYDNFYEKGNYHCVACDLLLFQSDSKFKSGCGWPSFSDLANEENINYYEDLTHNMSRIEVRCGKCNAHLGHVFNDGPPPSYLRYCINSLSLKFKKK